MPNLKHSLHTLRVKGVRLRTGRRTDITVSRKRQSKRPDFESLTIEPLAPDFESLAIEPLVPSFESLTIEPLAPTFEALTIEPIAPDFESLAITSLKPDFEDLRVSLFTVPDPRRARNPRPKNLRQPKLRS